MSVRYPSPAPAVQLRPVGSVPDRTAFLPAAPVADVELPFLITAPMLPPQGPRP